MIAFVTSDGCPIYLIGAPGVGKSTVGRLLAAHLDREHVDLDQEIEREAGMSVRDIFVREGEAGFRRREAAALRVLTDGVRLARVVSVGGGAPCHEGNLERMRSSGLVVRLLAEVSTLHSRLGDAAARPLLDGVSLRDLLSTRERFYAQADLSVDTTSISANEVAAQIAVKLHEQVRGWR